MSQNKLLLPVGLGVGSAPLAVVAGIFEATPALAGAGLIIFEVLGGIIVVGGAGTSYLWYRTSALKKRIANKKALKAQPAKTVEAKLSDYEKGVLDGKAKMEVILKAKQAQEAASTARLSKVDAAAAADAVNQLQAEKVKVKVPSPQDFQKLFDDFRIEAKRILIRAYGSYGVRPKVSEILDLLDKVESFNKAGLVSTENQLLVSEYLQKDLRKSLKYYSNDTPGKLYKNETIDHGITTQLDVIGNSLATVIEEAEKIVMVEARKQTDFLKTKLSTGIPVVPGLTLKKSGSETL
jgi:hypothetical protein